MKNLNKKEVIYFVIFIFGILSIVFLLFSIFIKKLIFHYNFLYIVGIVVGVIFSIIGFLLFIFEKYHMFKRPGLFSLKVNFIEALLIFFMIFLLCGTGFLIYYYTSLEDFEEFSIGIYVSSSSDPFNFISGNINNPVLTYSDVDDVKAGFVADPFLIFDNSNYYMFFEVFNLESHQGDIGLAVSNDGFNWSYSKIVLDESFHLSYPCVFKWEDEYYLIPETYQKNSVRLYKADDFPYTWSFVKTLLDGRDFVDNTIFEYNETWWLFTSNTNSDVLYLYYSSKPLGPWLGHPKNPIIVDDPNFARPGGNVIVFDNLIVRFCQDDYPYYGNQVWAFEITKLTKTEYEEHRIGDKPVLKGFENWNTLGMHHISPLQLDDGSWIASVDGN